MPKFTGIKNRAEYLEKLIKEDEEIGKKDTLYGEYLKSLSRLVALTNTIYEEKDGELDKDSYDLIIKQYLDVTQKCGEYKEKGPDKTRVSVVDYIQKVISKDLMALNNLNKENPGNIRDAFETSRTVKVVVPTDLSHRVGGQMSDRFPMRSTDGKKGFFTARVDTAQDEKWKEIYTAIEKVGLPKDFQEQFDELKTDHKLRYQISRIAFSNNLKNKPVDRAALLAVALGLFETKDEAKAAVRSDQKLVDALDIICSSKAEKLLSPYNLQNRLGYDPYTRNDNKNAAMYEVAKFLGCGQLIAKAVPMVVVNGDKVIKGTFMEHAEGTDLSNMKFTDPLWKYKAEESPYNKGLYRDMADLQVIDYICGNIDRHKANMFYKTEEGKDGKVKVTGLVGIDNDASFPEHDIPVREFEGFTVNNQYVSPRIYRPENFRYVTKKTAEIVKNMSRSQLETLLRGHNLSKKAIDLAWGRTKEIQDVLNNYKMFGISYADDLTEDVSREQNDKSNPFNKNDERTKPSIFTGFNTHMTDEIGYSYYLAYKGQEERFAKEGKKLGDKIDKKEYIQYMKSKEKEAEKTVYEAVTRETALVANTLKIQRLDTLMNQANRLKFASREFAGMRSAVRNLVDCHKNICDKVKEKTALVEKDFKDYEECLKALNDATKHYIQEKGIIQKTEKGRDRMEAARSILNIAEELDHSFDAEKHLDAANKDSSDVSYEMEK